MTAKCQKCDALLTSLRAESASAKGNGTSWRAVIYACPFCFTAISAQIDPITIRDEIIAAIRKEHR